MMIFLSVQREVSGISLVFPMMDPDDDAAVFCDSPLWDNNLTWYTDDPNFTNCFQKTILTVIPCAFLWIFFPIQLCIISHKKTSGKDTGTYLFWTKMTMGSVLCATSVMELIFSFYGLAVYGSRPVLGYDVPVHQYADIFMAIIQLLTYVLYIFYVVLDWRKRRASNGALLIFWLLTAVTEGVILRTQIKLLIDLGVDSLTEKFCVAIKMIQSAFIFALLIFSSFSSYSCHFNKDVQTFASPERHSPFLSQLLFWWFNRQVYNLKILT
ncbi:ATP-binding cassette sub-family C member 3-like [Paramacrobiotus metropolitanus]|uniref:ATP-binding cassette sub-family C member 3-like n=1 Tax=Paramacrobiotus metropolitanus TaxID=2943436 RepID=UPI002445F2D5|nr:ATP-binding cassette sub-family C member 3-like [Paramacrobiotus metropolitanus]